MDPFLTCAMSLAIVGMYVRRLFEIRRLRRELREQKAENARIRRLYEAVVGPDTHTVAGILLRIEADRPAGVSKREVVRRLV